MNVATMMTGAAHGKTPASAANTNANMKKVLFEHPLEDGNNPTPNGRLAAKLLPVERVEVPPTEAHQLGVIETRRAHGGAGGDERRGGQLGGRILCGRDTDRDVEHHVADVIAHRIDPLTEARLAIRDARDLTIDPVENRVELEQQAAHQHRNVGASSDRQSRRDADEKRNEAYGVGRNPRVHDSLRDEDRHVAVEVARDDPVHRFAARFEERIHRLGMALGRFEIERVHIERARRPLVLFVREPRIRRRFRDAVAQHAGVPHMRRVEWKHERRNVSSRVSPRGEDRHVGKSRVGGQVGVHRGITDHDDVVGSGVA